MNYKKQVGYLKGLCKGLSFQPDTPEHKLIYALIETIDSLADALSDSQEEIEELADDLQSISDEIGELESISDDIDELEEQIDQLSENISAFSAIYGDVEQSESFRPTISRPIHLLSKSDKLDEIDDDDDDEDDDDDDDEICELFVKCPKCGERIKITDENIAVDNT